MGKRMNISQLQGTPWHTEQLKRTCNDGSKYCIYNHNICSCTFNKSISIKNVWERGNVNGLNQKQVHQRHIQKQLTRRKMRVRKWKIM